MLPPPPLLPLVQLLLVLAACAFGAPQPPPRTFGAGIPSLPLQPGVATPIFNHTVAAGSTLGVLNHLWSVGPGSAAKPELDGIQIYSFYVDGEPEPSVRFSMRAAAGIIFDPVIADKRDVQPLPNGSALLPDGPPKKLVNSSAIPISALTPWGTEWLGKGSDMEGYYNNFKLPFSRSLLVTVELPAWAPKGLAVWTILRGEENVPLTLGGRALPPTARLRTHTNTQVFVDDMGFTPLVNSTGGSGVVFGHTLGIEMGRNPVRQRYYTFLEPHLQRINLPRQARDKDEKILNKRVSPQHVNPLGFLEGCFHLITPFSGVGVSALQQQYGVGAGFPGVVLSTGMEDYCT
jgi:hypothetical protein